MGAIDVVWFPKHRRVPAPSFTAQFWKEPRVRTVYARLCGEYAGRERTLPGLAAVVGLSLDGIPWQRPAPEVLFAMMNAASQSGCLELLFSVAS